MPEFKEKPGPGKRGKARPPSAALPRQAARQMKEKAVRERKQPAEETERGSGYAEERVEQAGRWAVKELAGTAAPTRRARKPESRPKEEDHTGQEAGQDTPADAARTEEGPPSASQPKERKVVEQRDRESASWQQRRRPKVQAGPWAQGAAGSQRAGHNTHKARTPAGFWHTTGPQPFRQGRIATRPFPLEQPSARLCRVTPGREQRRPGGRAARLRQSSPPEHTKGSGTQTGRRSRKAHPPRI